jgi:hypothetical protein
MAENTEMDAKDIAALFRSVVEAEDQALLGDTSTFAEQDFFIQLGWFTNQIEARLKKNTPSPDILALMATLGGAIGKLKPEDCIDKAYETWQTGDAKIRAATLCSREEIEENLSQVGRQFRLAPWPKNDDGADRKNLEVTPFLRLCIPFSDVASLERYFKRCLKDNPLGEKSRTSAEVEKELKRIKAKRLVPKDHSHEGAALVAWWMKQKEFKPLDFPRRSWGYLAQRGFGFIPTKRGKKSPSSS